MGARSGRADPVGLTVALLTRPNTGPAGLSAVTDVEGALEPLLAAHRADRPVRVMRTDGHTLHESAGWAPLAEGAAAILIVPVDEVAGSGRWHPPTYPFARSRDGRPVPIGWLAPSMLPGATGAARAAIERRKSPAGPIVLLGPGRGRTAASFDVLEAEWSASSTARRPFRWTSDRVGWEDLRPGLASGLGVVLYMGHATSESWPAYGGVTADRLADAVVGRVPISPSTGRPIGVLLALTCHGAGAGGADTDSTTSMAPDIGSFGSRIVALGTAAAVLAAIGPIDHSINRRLAGALMAALGRGDGTLAELVARTAGNPQVAASLAGYRIIGDPLAPVSGDDAAWTAAGLVPATDPAAPLPGPVASWPSRSC